MEIIELTAKNIEQYLDGCLEVQTYLVSNLESINPDHFRETAADTAGYFICVVDDGRVCGLGLVSRQSHPVDITGHINNIVVHPDSRGQGLFKVIMDNLEQYAWDKWGCTDISLTCSRELVQVMYEKRGYVEKLTKFYLLRNNR
jgi:GNAT superfamily N-acetyltransferase